MLSIAEKTSGENELSATMTDNDGIVISLLILSYTLCSVPFRTTKRFKKGGAARPHGCVQGGLTWETV